MDVYWPLRRGVFAYDTIRLFFLLRTLTVLTSPGEEALAFSIPYLIYAAPNALFPLMAFFLMIKPLEYRSYLSLYIAGKAVAVSAALGWAYFTLFSDISFFRLRLALGGIFIPSIALIMALLDGATIVFGTALSARLREAESQRKPDPGEKRDGETGEIPEESQNGGLL